MEIFKEKDEKKTEKMDGGGGGEIRLKISL